ncbi:MAG: hypothetical protein UW68_C0033G0017 [Candidatus Collierbacteria bacterium GW2011_GWB1_44_6]|uniref:Uncharacterized protein n=1 Tax=Candidatus Collierbacteria bacterium GW2011_GWB1_44_6 TaxID=1618384 RepID=A0A0G1JMG1_9BACT|nr:MAG: hypothetical protein UW68_C0033G0017 [Candidatus Collierbacteria bacterium GW2011_GWB1_44_6]KKT82039.1 MAG: hypothetical protein UW80_C0043G0008 [Microgenomates group bacterium GW2011_GWC1_44_9]
MKWWKWVFISSGVLLVGFLVVFQFFGLKYILKANSYINSHPEAREKLYGLASNRVYGGTFAGVYGDRIGIWGRQGLKLYKGLENMAKYSVLRGCNSSEPIMEKYDDAKTWGRSLRIGDYVFVNYAINDEKTAVILWGSDLWLFVTGESDIQCTRL